MKSEQDFYREDLAYVHHSDFSELSVQAAKLLEQRLGKNQLKTGTIVDLGCGSGLLCAALSKKNYDLIGVDYSKAILDLAKKNAPDAQFVQASIWDYEIPACVAVTAIGEIITYEFDFGNTDENIRHLFTQIYNRLANGGIFIFDFLQADLLDPSTDQSKMIEGKDWTLFVNYREDKLAKRLIREITLFKKKDSGLYRKSQESHQVRLFETLQLVEMLELAGFKVELCDNYGNMKFRKNHLGIIATKA